MNYKKKAIKIKMNNSFMKNLSLNLLSKIFFMKNDSSYMRVEDRNIFIKKDWIGFKLAVYNGKFYIPLVVKENMVGKLLGSLIFTKKILLKSKKKYRK